MPRRTKMVSARRVQPEKPRSPPAVRFAGTWTTKSRSDRHQSAFELRDCARLAREFLWQRSDLLNRPRGARRYLRALVRPRARRRGDVWRVAVPCDVHAARTPFRQSFSCCRHYPICRYRRENGDDRRYCLAAHLGSSAGMGDWTFVRRILDCLVARDLCGYGCVLARCFFWKNAFRASAPPGCGGGGSFARNLQALFQALARPRGRRFYFYHRHSGADGVAAAL